MVAARTVMGLSQADLCRLTGLPSSQVSQWEGGKYRPSLDAVVPLLPFLGVGLDYIYLGDTSGMSWERKDALANAWEQALEAAALEEEAVAKAVGQRATKPG